MHSSRLSEMQITLQSRRRDAYLSFDDGDQAYCPKPVPLFNPHNIILTKGDLRDPQRRILVEAICNVYPKAEIIERLDVPHNRIDLGNTDPLGLHYLGKETLVFGEHRSALRQSNEEGNTCPNYWHFSPYGFCPYDCQYCYLAGTRGVRFSPTVKIFLNLPEILEEIDVVASRIGKPTAFYVGKLQDGLALDPLTGYSRILVPFFANHSYANMILLTKSSNVENLLDLDHRGHTILSWSLNPEEIHDEFEANTPTVSDRIDAMCKCATAGYPLRAVIMPIIPVTDWRQIYNRFLHELLGRVRLERITLGSVCIYPAARNLMESKLGESNTISQALIEGVKKCPDGRSRYDIHQRVEMYRHLIATIRRLQADLPIGLCLEEHAAFEALNLMENIGRCNCVL